jgi:hypothetical protein
MNSQHILSEIYEKYGEWIEMSDDPQSFVVEILSKRIIDQNSHIKYLQKVLKFEELTKN